MSASAALRAEFFQGKDLMTMVRRILRWVNFVVCPYDGINLKAVGRLLGLAGSLPMRCPECGRRFELADGEVIEPLDAVEDGSKA